MSTKKVIDSEIKFIYGFGMADKSFSVVLSPDDMKALKKIQDSMSKTMGRVSNVAAIRAAIRTAASVEAK